MKETETGCQLGPMYFEALARALAMGVLTRLLGPPTVFTADNIDQFNF